MRSFTNLCAAAFVASLLAAAGALAQPVLITAAKTISPGDTTITSTAGGTPVQLVTAQITVSSATVTVNGRHTIGSLTLLGTAIVRHDSAFSYDADPGVGVEVVNGLDLTVTGDVSVAADSRFDVTGRGFGVGQGPGAGLPGSNFAGGGGGYGGSGRPVPGVIGGTTYGSFTHPTDLGSGGAIRPNQGGGGAGGGALRLNVAGEIAVAGLIRSNGVADTNSNGGSGSGGSIWITAGTMSGAGTIEANGGSGGYIGGGGRVAIQAASSTFSGIIRAESTGPLAGPGSVYTEIGSQTPTLIYSGAGYTELTTPLELTGNLITRNGAYLSHIAQAAGGLSIQVSGNATFEANSGVDVTGRGFGVGQGPGAGISTNIGSVFGGGGGGYGGSGRRVTGVIGGTTYGSFTHPTDLGSGGAIRPNQGGGGAGGGALRLNVAGEIAVAGLIRSNGVADTNSNGGSGSGGSIWITAGTMSGAGTIEANGGSGGYQGGGGRVAIYRCNQSTSTVIVRALSGGSTATAGTVFVGEAGGTIEPISIACLGYNATLNARIAGVGALTYQWRRMGVPVVDGVQPSGTIIAGATTAALTFTNITLAERGFYDVVVTTACGVYTSPPLNFTVSGERCQPADVAWDNGEILPPIGPCTLGNTNTGVNEGDYNAFFNTFFTNQAINSAADIAYDSGESLPPFGPSGDSRVNNGVNEGDYNCFFNNFFNGCPA